MFTEQQIQNLAPKESTFKAGKKLGLALNWESLEQSKRAVWGAIRGSGKKPYLVQIDTANIAYKCTCPSRQFPCKHAVGLLIVLCKEKDSILEVDEPDYVKDWLEKRSKRASKVDQEEKELSDEELLKRAAAKSKRQNERMQFALAGVAELKLWLTDLIRIGLLELPSRPSSYFDAMMERMVDSKVPGLSGWIRSLKNLPYRNQQVWQDQAIEIISKVFLLIKATEHLEQYPLSEQNAIKGLLGWTFNQKDLSSDEHTITKKDKWLVLGALTEKQDDLTIHRYWLSGINSGQDAMIIRFENRFTNNDVQIPIVEGSILEAELAFYPALFPHRAFIKKQKEVLQFDQNKVKSYSLWASYQNDLVKLLEKDPWTNNRSGIIDHVKIIRKEQSLIAVDSNKNFRKISVELEEDKASTLLLNASSQSVSLSFVDRQDGILPLGLLIQGSYRTL